MMQKRKVGFIAMVPFLMATVGFAGSANAAGGK